MPVSANEVLNGEMMRYVARPGSSPSVRAGNAAREARAADRRDMRLERARKMFPNVSDYEALAMLRDYEDDYR